MTTTPRVTVHREWKSQGGWVMGIVVIALGVLFLLHNLGLHLAFLEFNNWWAVLILLCAIGPLSLAYRQYRASERIDANIAYYLTSAAAILSVGFIFLLDLRWDRWWPLFVIYGGLWMLVRRTYPRMRTGTAAKNDPSE